MGDLEFDEATRKQRIRKEDQVSNYLSIIFFIEGLLTSLGEYLHFPLS